MVAGGCIAGETVQAQPPGGLAFVVESATGKVGAQLGANGVIEAAVSDGHGGWFVSGSFTRIGGLRRTSVAHVTAAGAVDKGWHPTVGHGQVVVQALSHTGRRLYLAGVFSQVGGRARPGLAAVDSATGALDLAWKPPRGIGSATTALLREGKRLIAAGQAGVVALDVRTGAVDSHWNAHVDVIGDAGTFSALALHGDRIYVAGAFRVHALRQNGLVAFEAATGRPDPRFSPDVANCPSCIGFALVYDVAASGRRMYVSGDFDRIGGVARHGLAAIDPTTGAVDRAWRADRSQLDILRLRLAAGHLYIGGESGLWALEPRNGRLLPGWSGYPVLAVLSIAASGPRLLVTGRD
jgi:hypothetical protein